MSASGHVILPRSSGRFQTLRAKPTLCAKRRPCQRDGVSAAGLVGADHAVLHKIIEKRSRKSLIGENAIPVEAVVRRENNVITNGDLHVFDARWLAVSARASGTNCHA